MTQPAVATTDPVVVVVAEAESGAGVLGVLRDWSAAGLLRPFLWVTPHQAQAVGRIAATAVSPGGIRRTSLEAFLAERGRLGLLRVCVLDQLSGVPLLPVGVEVARRLAEAAPNGQVTRIHLLAIPIGAEVERPYEVTDAWHRVVLAPEDRFSPADAADLIWAADDPTTRDMHMAAGLAGFAGLWQGLDSSPMDARKAPTGRLAMLGRGYFSKRDAALVSADLQSRLTDFSAGFPRTFRDGTALPHFANEQAAVTQAANALLAAHDWVLASSRVSLAPPTGARLGILAALRMFLSFVWAAARNAPRDWLNRTIAEGEAAIAGFGQSVIGVESVYSVVVRGRLADGSLATAEQVDQALEATRSSSAAAAHHEATPKLGLLWRDFLEVGLSLADGRARVAAVPQPTVGGVPGVVSSPAAIAAAPDLAFTRIPPEVAAELRVTAIAPPDLYRTETILTELGERRRRNIAPLDLGRVAAELRGWQRTVQLSSFAGQVGMSLAQRISQLRQQLADDEATLAGLGEPVESDDEFLVRQEKLARRMRVVLWIGLIYPTVLALGRWQDWLSHRTALLLAGFGLTLWLVVLAVMFVLLQRLLFMLLTRRGRAEEAGRTAQANLRSGLADLDQVIRAYGQFTYWASVLGAFAARPFGPEPTACPPPRQLTGELPRSLQVGVVRPDPVAQAAADAAVRPLLYPQGWLEEPYRVLRALAADVTGNQAVGGEGQTASLFQELCRPDTKDLAALTELVCNGGVGQAARAELWERAEGVLSSQPLAAVRAALLRPTNWAGERSAEIAQGGALHTSAGSAAFAGQLLRSAARTHGELLVQPELTVRLVAGPDGLSRTVGLTEFGGGFPPEELDLRLAERPTAPRVDPAPRPGRQL
ncbi:MAG: hypothetical protein ACOYEV_09030 [Candidatus Nanopelagicales bacterium]